MNPDKVHAYENPGNQVLRKLAIGPLNAASQATAWADATRTYLAIDAFSAAFDGVIARRLKGPLPKDRSERPIPHFRLSPSFWRQRLVSQRLRGVTHLLNESNDPFMGDPRGSRFTDELEWYADKRISTGVVFHGSDARDPELSMELMPHSFFHDANREFVAKLGAGAANNRNSVIQARLPTFVTTLDLLEHLPGAKYLPLCVDVDAWGCSRDPFTRGLPRVLHRPARGEWDSKGTRYIMPVLEELERESRIVLVRSDSVPRSKMHSLYEEADIVIDQLQAGVYGTTSIEALAAGRLVIANIAPQIREYLGGQVPIIDADPASFRTVMYETLADTGHMAEIASQGSSYVNLWHNGERSAQVLSEFVGVNLGSV